MTNRDADVERQLPLAPAVLHILIALGEGDRHGYAIMQEVSERTAGKVRMSPGTLYGSIRKMLDDGLIEELFHRGAHADDDRRRYYCVTKFGRAVAAAEAERLTALLHHARLNGLLPRRN
ncbi:MAG TPA: helix-turn-helix transcriptional regulator [Vicinamibacterales bacterium]|nr:helix-turn-helix transcriptional regulator [Vicinamibacterales bacterium]